MAWIDQLPPEYLDRVRYDPTTGEPACIDVTRGTPGTYDVDRDLTEADRRRCHLPPLIERRPGDRPWETRLAQA